MQSEKSPVEKEEEIKRWEEYLSDMFIALLLGGVSLLLIFGGSVALYLNRGGVMPFYMILIGGCFLIPVLMEINRIQIKKRAGGYKYPKG